MMKPLVLEKHIWSVIEVLLDDDCANLIGKFASINEAQAFANELWSNSNIPENCFRLIYSGSKHIGGVTKSPVSTGIWERAQDVADRRIRGQVEPNPERPAGWPFIVPSAEPVTIDFTKAPGLLDCLLQERWGRCQAKKVDGRPCMRGAGNDGFCHQHRHLLTRTT